MQLEVRERMLAAQVAGARHLVHWLLGTLAVVAPVLALVSARTGNRTLLVQLVPLSVVTAFEYDFAYGRNRNTSRRRQSASCATSARSCASPARRSRQSTCLTGRLLRLRPSRPRWRARAALDRSS